MRYFIKIKERVNLLQAGIIIILTFVCYIPAVRSGFIWDDPELITENPLIHAHNGLSLIWWTTGNPDYFPLTSTSFWLEWRLWKNNPAGYHVTNVLLHALGSVLIWQVLKRLRIRGAWFAALIFAVHPVCVESVAWISEQKNTLSMVFYVLSLLLYLKFENHPRSVLYCLSVGAFLLALLSKTSVVMLPVVILLCVLWQRQRITRNDVLRSIPFFILSIILSVVTIWFQYHRSIGAKMIPIGGALDRLARAGKVIWFYIYKVLLPVNLMMPYPQWKVNVSYPVSFLLDLILICSFVVFWRYRRTWGRPLLFALGYFVITLFPVLGFFKMHYMVYSPVADHFQYVAMIGVIALLGGVIAYLCDRLPNSQLVTGIIGLVIIGIPSVLSWQQEHIYKDGETLWTDNISRNPNSWVAYNNLGLVYFKKGLYRQAMFDYNKSLEINATDDLTYNNRGVAFGNNGLYDEAISDFNRAIEMNPRLAMAYNNRGNAYYKTGLYDEAISDFNAAIDLNPWLAAAYYNRGVAYGKKGLYNQAILDYDKAIEINPGYAEAFLNKALDCEKIGRVRESIEAYQGFIQFAPPKYHSYIEQARRRIKVLEK